jgi:hypothetical protein
MKHRQTGHRLQVKKREPFLYHYAYKKTKHGQAPFFAFSVWPILPMKHRKRTKGSSWFEQQFENLNQLRKLFVFDAP